jgi:hypothetical protein
MKHKKHNDARHYDEPEINENEKETERSRQQAMAARERATRTQLSAGQTKVQRLHKGNQPRGR